MHDHETQGHPYMSPHVSPRAGIRNRSSPIVSSSPSSVISLSSSDSEPEDIDVDAMSSSSFPPSPPLTRPDPSVAPPIVDAQLLEEHAEHFHPGGDVKILVHLPFSSQYSTSSQVAYTDTGWTHTISAACRRPCPPVSLVPFLP